MEIDGLYNNKQNDILQLSATFIQLIIIFSHFHIMEALIVITRKWIFYF